MKTVRTVDGIAILGDEVVDEFLLKEALILENLKPGVLLDIEIERA